MERCLGEAAALDLTDEVRQAWLYDNAHAFFDSPNGDRADRCARLVHNRAHYVQHMTANWGAIGQEDRGQLCSGV